MGRDLPYSYDGQNPDRPGNRPGNPDLTGAWDPYQVAAKMRPGVKEVSANAREIRFEDHYTANISGNAVDLFGPNRQRVETALPDRTISYNGDGSVKQVDYNNLSRVAFENANGGSRPAALTTAKGENVAVTYGGNGTINGYRITDAAGQIKEQGTLAGSGWQINGQGRQDLQSVQFNSDKTNRPEGVNSIAFVHSNNTAEIHTLGGRQVLVDTSPTAVVARDGQTVGHKVLWAKSANDRQTEFSYANHGNLAQLNGYTVRDRQGNVKEFGVYNAGADASSSGWKIWRAGWPGQPGLPIPIDQSKIDPTHRQESIDAQQRAYLAQLTSAAGNPAVHMATPMKDNLVKGDYNTPADVRTDQYGRKYEELANGETVVHGDDGKIFRSHGGIDSQGRSHWSISRTTSDGCERLVSTDGAISRPGGMKTPTLEHFTYNEQNQVTAFTEKYPGLKTADGQDKVNYFRRQGDRWQQYDPEAKATEAERWVDVPLNVQANNDGSVSIQSLNAQRQVAFERRMYNGGGESDFELRSGQLRLTEIKSATNDDTRLAYDASGNLNRVENIPEGTDPRTPFVYTPDPNNACIWYQRGYENCPFVGGARFAPDGFGVYIGTWTNGADGSKHNAFFDQRGRTDYAAKHANLEHLPLPQFTGDEMDATHSAALVNPNQIRN